LELFIKAASSKIYNTWCCSTQKYRYYRK